MIKIVTQSSNEHGQTLQHAELARTMFEDAVDAVGHMETMTPVMVGHRAVILLNSYEESGLEIIMGNYVIYKRLHWNVPSILPECCNQTSLSQTNLQT